MADGEAAGASAFLISHVPSDMHESSYRLIWDTIAANFLDRKNGGWHEELTEDLKPAHTIFAGKGDIYHALQACLIPLYPAEGSITEGDHRQPGDMRLLLFRRSRNRGIIGSPAHWPPAGRDRR